MTCVILRDWPLAERLQRCFTETRLAHFKLEPGVKVRLDSLAGCRSVRCWSLLAHLSGSLRFRGWQ